MAIEKLFKSVFFYIFQLQPAIPMQVFLVHIETSGNQQYIFETNRLRENVGASELTMRVGRDFVLDAVREFGCPDLTANRAAVLESATNPPIENADTIVEVVVATSGKALLLVRNREIGEQIIERVTLRAITVVPGIQVRGSIVEFDWAENSSFAVAQTKAIHELEQLRSEWPGTNQRFQRLPMVQECASSGLPASTFGTLGDDRPQPISLVVKAKRTAAEAGANLNYPLIFGWLKVLVWSGVSW